MFRIAAVKQRRIARQRVGRSRSRVWDERWKREKSVDRQHIPIRISRAIRSACIEVQNARHRRRRGRPYCQLIPDDVTHIACKREVGSIADHGVPIWLPMRRSRCCVLIDWSRLTHRHRRMRRINDNLGHRHIRRIHRQKRGKRIPSGQQKNRHIAR